MHISLFILFFVCLFVWNLDCCQFLIILNSLSVKIVVHKSWCIYAEISHSIYLWVEFQGYSVLPCLGLLSKAKLLFEMIYKYILPKAVNESYCSTSLPTLGCSTLANFHQSDGNVILSLTVFLTCNPLISNAVEHLFKCYWAVDIPIF